MTSIIEILSKYEEFKEFHEEFKVIAANITILQKLVSNIDALIDVHSNLSALLSISALNVTLLLSVTLDRTIGGTTQVAKSQLSGTSLVANKSLFYDLSGTISVYTSDANSTTANLTTLTTSPTNIDSIPSVNSTNLITSGGVYALGQSKVDKVTLTNRIYGTDSSGNQTTFDKDYLGGAEVLTLTSATLTRSVSGVTTVAKASLNNPSATLIVNQTIITDSRGTLGLYTEDINATTINVLTKVISPTGSSSAAFLGVVANRAALPLTVTDAVIAFGRTPVLDNYCRITNDENHSGASTEIYVTDIVGNVISWGNDYVISDANFQASTTDLDAGNILVGGATPGTFGTAIDPASLEKVVNKVTTVSATSTDVEYPSALSVQKYVTQAISAIPTPTAPIAANISYDNTVVTENALTSTNAQTAIDEVVGRVTTKADISSPIFTGTPTSPTPDKDDSSDRIATTEWTTTIIDSAIAGIGVTSGRIVTLSRSSANCLYSDDNGKTWITVTLPSSDTWQNLVRLDSGRLLGTNESNNSIIISDDNGETWSIGTSLPFSGAYKQVIVTSTNRILVLQTGNCAISDNEGNSWTTVTLPNTASRGINAIGITKSGRIISFVNVTSTSFIYSDNDGDTWSTGTLPIDMNISSPLAVLSTGRLFVQSNSALGTLISDNNGDSWTEVTTPLVGYVYTIKVLANDRLLVLSNSGSQTGNYSDDGGITWSSVTLSSIGIPGWRGAIAITSTGRVILFAMSGVNLVYSDDNGSTWTNSTLPITGTWYGAIVATPEVSVSKEINSHNASPTAHAIAINLHDTSSTAHSTAMALKANLANPTFTGTPKAPTPPTSDSSTQLATTEFVHTMTENLGIPVGFEAMWPASTAPTGWLDESLNIGLIPRTTYSELWAFALASGNLLDDTTWQANFTANGTVPSFSTGDGSTTFRIPLLRKVYVRAADVDSGLGVGTYQDFAQQKLSGSSAGLFGEGLTVVTAGIMRRTPTSTAHNFSVAAGGTHNIQSVSINTDYDTSLKTDTEVRPITAVRLPIIKAFDSLSVGGSLDVTGLVTQVNQISDIVEENRAISIPSTRVVSTIQDFNTYTTPGTWDFREAVLHVNGPPEYATGYVPAGFLRVTKSPGIGIFQEYMVWQYNGEYTSGLVYSRGYHEGLGWGQWKKNSSELIISASVTTTVPSVATPLTLPYVCRILIQFQADPSASDSYLNFSSNNGTTYHQILATKWNGTSMVQNRLISPLLPKGGMVYVGGTAVVFNLIT